MKKMLKSKLFHVLCCGIFLVMAIVSNGTIEEGYAAENILIDRDESMDDAVYLSDIPYQRAQVGWGTVGLNKTSSNTALNVVVNGSTTTFKKGIWAHATSTVEYDISDYKDYDYFSTYYGLTTSAGNNGNGVKFYIYTSVDGKTWDLKTEENPTALKSANSAVKVKIDIRDVNYIRLYANDNGSNGSDHAVWADAKLIKEGYSENVTRTVEELDAEIKSKYRRGPIQDDLRLTLLQRDLINRMGQYNLRSFIEADPKNKETLEWFLNDEEALRLWTVGGTPNGSYLNALNVLSRLYHAHKEDLLNENLTANGVKYKDLYLKMMLSLSLTHSAGVPLWISGNQYSDAVIRYEIYKDMHLNNQLGSASMFETLTVEEMRWLMHVNIDDEEIKWLRDYSTKWTNTNDRFNPYKYMKYTFGYSYYRPIYYSQANYAKWDKKYNLSKYNITYQSGKPKLWIVFEEGAVCGGLSKTAANLWGVWGYPASTVGQPGHCAYIYMYNAGGGKNAWQLANSVVSTGWANTSPLGHMPNGWGGGGYYATNRGSIKSASYFFLAQEAQNEYEKYEQAELILLLANVYRDDWNMLDQIYHDALAEENINLDAWLGVINMAIDSRSGMSQADLFQLAEEVADVMTWNPLPMYDLTRRIGTKITAPEYKANLLMLQNETLNKAKSATFANTVQYKEVPVVAQAILGEVDSRIATFSFDGPNAGKIVLSKQLQSSQVTWSYSLDGGNTWKDNYTPSVQLTQGEIDSIDVNKDIKVHIVGLPREEKNIYTINITKGVFPTASVSTNDEEDKLFGATEQMEWTFDLAQGWNSFADSNPVLSGDKRLYMRVGATGTSIASDTVHYTFTNNRTDDKKAYIKTESLSVSSVSEKGSGDPNSILDGNLNTFWSSYRTATYYPGYVVIQTDRPRYITAVDFVPAKGAVVTGIGGGMTYGRPETLEVYVSMDGEEWTLAGKRSGLSNDLNTKTITLDQPVLASYVKVYCPKVHSSISNAFAVSGIKLYEDLTVDKTPYADVNYNIVKKTNKNVTVELVNPTKEIKVTNNGGKTTYTFTQNGSFTFEFEDKQGHKGSTTATVDWIDKTVPQMNVSYSTTNATNEDVVATLSFTKPNVTITSSDVDVATNPVDNSKTITFLENESYHLEFTDELGNVGTKTVSVNWIDKEAPTALFEYSTTAMTDKEVVATLDPSEPVTVLNNGGKDTYTFEDNGSFTFEFQDEVGNIGSATANVFWIADMPEVKVTYSNEKPTNQNVTATLEIEAGYKLMNNGGKNVYTFEDSGEFAFEYIAPNGLSGRVPVVVDWIDKINPTGEFTFSTEKPTNKSVVATLKPSEKVKILNNGGKDTYTFTNNGEFTFEFEDMVGNQGSAKVSVDWIDRVIPNALLEYSTKSLTNQSVTVTLKPDKEVTVLNNDGKTQYTFDKNGEFTFEYVDAAGNRNKTVAEVTWIDKTAPTATIEYSTRGQTNGAVIATLRPNENVKILNNGGKNTYTFTKNGSFTFEFADAVGNKGTATASVDWIGTSSSNGNQSSNNTQLDNANKPFYDTINIGNGTDDKKYQSVTSDKISVKLPEELLAKYPGASLSHTTLNLSDIQKERYGKDSEGYEVQLVSKDKQAIDVSNENIEQTIRLKEGKKLVAVYGINEDGSVVKLNFDINDQNELVFQSKGLGKFIISYESDIKDKDDKDDPKKEENTKPESSKEEDAGFTDQLMNFLPWAAIIAVAAIGGGFFFIKWKNGARED
ncbi:MAG: hypothetical protein HFE68_05670 [Erysipelotrichaceae bacterium]|nr:hypothetical protein [Erysipelotrichaceae bacterium]